MKYIAIITTLAGISLGNTLPPTPEAVFSVVR